MNYKLHYNKLIQKARNRCILKSEYKEIHHIIPKCMGGNNCKDNLVSLFPEEHLIAHLMLMKIYPESYSILKAAFSMTNGFNKGTRTLNKEYKWLREKYAKHASIWMKENHYLNKMSIDEREKFLNEYTRGEKNPNFGNKWNDEQRKRLSIQRKGKYIGEDNPNYGNRGEKNPIFGKPKSEEHKRKMSLCKLGEKNAAFGKKGKLAKEAKLYIIKTPDGENIELFGTLETSLKEFCIAHNLNFCTIRNSINKGVIGKTYKSYKNKIDVVNCEGWEISRD